jgi:hypothetical protein
MLNHDIPREALLGHVRLGYDRLVEVRSGHDRADHVRTA